MPYIGVGIVDAEIPAISTSAVTMKGQRGRCSAIAHASGLRMAAARPVRVMVCAGAVVEVMACIGSIFPMFWKYGSMGCEMARTIPHPSTGSLELTSVLRVLGDPIRLAALRVLASRGETNCTELREQLQLPLSTCSYHVKLLREAGVTLTRASGTERFISVRRDDLDARFPGLLDSLLNAE
jgi:DNA-binding transcriptional ArsR family regulator